ncbi:alpha/beta hydrolase [Pseudorhodoferax sp.]|uniref:alpha/beta hydrolase n=1 Tax=Pseudorhodoferax sp. TaxID=1993553 RepID=UPI002DD6782D|nr:alpha/beta hydrolase [Pseudorhodoferax sp.]
MHPRGAAAAAFSTFDAMPLHPVFASALQAARLAGRPGLSSGSVAQARALVDGSTGVLGPGEAVESVSEQLVATRGGSVAARLYRPFGGPRALLVYFHGGGWVAGALASFDALARTLASRSQSSVLLVDYRLAPEHPFPAAVDDAEDAVRWAAARLPELAAAGVPLMVGGDSAGANLATVTAAALRDALPIALQLLFYPVADTDLDTDSYRRHGTGYLLAAEDMRWFLSHYAPQDRWHDGRIAPLRAAQLPRAPAWIGLAEYDVLLTEGEAYAQRLAAAGVPVTCRRYDGLTHGFARWFNLVDSASHALDDAAAAIAAACATHPTKD